MTDADLIIALERELDDTRRAAVHIVLLMVDAVAKTPEKRDELARGFALAATDSDPVTARLARLIAAAVREDVRPGDNRC